MRNRGLQQLLAYLTLRLELATEAGEGTLLLRLTLAQAVFDGEVFLHI